MEYTTAIGICWMLMFILPMWMVAVMCMKCRNAAPTRIASYGDYIDSKHFSHGNTVSSFTVIRQSNYQPPVNNHLLPPSPHPNSRRTSLLEEKESDNESLPNYENTAKESSDDETDYPNTNTNYIVVIPDNAATVTSPQTTSRTSHVNRISSGTLTEDYENLKEDIIDGAQGGSSNYVNIDEMDKEIGKNSEEDDDEEASDYVNSSKCVVRH
ncbi:uncharacterized protein [Scyliorhinus torazame]|uniref:uncharacterized protein n=1 Tax=Scyliorhinus torazame TaxID=75743 RepID=UPI003B58D139